VALARRPLREDIYQALLERLLDGTLEPGRRINEKELCAELGVSRTPLREALIRLEQDGFLRNDMARGFTVQPLSASEIRDLYPIIWTLEALAVRLSPKEAIRSTLPNLERILEEMETIEAGDFAGVENLDVEWHASLRVACGNEKLQELVGGLRQLIRRYDFAYKRDPALRRNSINQHKQILGALHDGDLDGAVDLIKDHWRHGMEQDLAQLAQRESSHSNASE